jgi:hypothetical protein
MKIEAITINPAALLNDISEAIKDEKLKTWAIVDDTQGNKYFTHVPEQWYKKVIIKPSINDDRLILSMYWYNSNIPDEATKGYYLGRFTEVLMVHFSSHFTKLETYT